MILLAFPAARSGQGTPARACDHTQAGNGANRRGLQARLEPSTCDFEVIFNARAILVSQHRQFSVIARRVYSSSTTSSMFCERSNVHCLLLKVACCFKGNKKPLALRGISNIASSPHLAETQKFRRNWHPFSLHCEGGCRVSQGRSLHPS